MSSKEPAPVTWIGDDPDASPTATDEARYFLTSQYWHQADAGKHYSRCGARVSGFVVAVANTFMHIGRDCPRCFRPRP